MKTFNDLCLRFENPVWQHYPELAVMDSILESHPELVNLVKDDVTRGSRSQRLGRKDGPSVEQIMRAAIYKEIKRVEYRQLEADLYDSTVCREFIKLDGRQPFSFEVLHKYISIIRKESLVNLMFAINRLMIGEGIEDVQKVRIDSTVVEAPIHYPTNNALVWDCFKEFYRLVAQLKKHCRELKVKNHKKQAKKTITRSTSAKNLKNSRNYSECNSSCLGGLWIWPQKSARILIPLIHLIWWIKPLPGNSGHSCQPWRRFILRATAGRFTMKKCPTMRSYSPFTNSILILSSKVNGKFSSGTK
jgi:hypothetical protein